LGTAAFILSWSLGLAVRDYSDVREQLTIFAATTMCAVVLCGGAIFLLRLCGLRRYHLLDPPLAEHTKARLQFSLANIIEVTTTVALVAALFGSVRTLFDGEYFFFVGDTLHILLLGTGFFTLVGIAAILVTLTRGEVGPKIVVFLACLFAAEW